MGGGILKSKVIALCDTDAIYCDRFLNYYMKHKSLGIEFVTYTSVKVLLEDTHQNDISIYLLTEDFWISELCEDQTKNVIYFSKENEIEEYAKEVYTKEKYVKKEYAKKEYAKKEKANKDGTEKGSSLSKEQKKLQKRIFKYQSIDSVLRELSRLESEDCQTNADQSAILLKQTNQSNNRIVSIFSPSNEDVQSYISLCIAKQLGNEKRVLYLNLLENTGMEQLFEEKFENDISDFFYFLKQKKGDLQKRLQGLVYHTSKFDYIPAAFQAKGLYELSEEDRIIFFRFLRLLKYDVIVVDFGNSIMGIEELIKESDHTYCLTREHWAARIRMNHFMNTIAHFEVEQSKIQVCKIPTKVNTFTIKQGSILELETPEISSYANKILQEIAW